MIKLGKVFDRFPQLTSDQRNELARRRALRAVKICFIVPEILMTNRGFFICNLVMRVHMV